MSPQPNCGEYSLSMHWFTILFLPIIPLGWHFIVGGEEQNSYHIIKKASWSDATQSLGMRGVVMTIVYAYATNIILGIVIFGLMFFMQSCARAIRF